MHEGGRGGRAAGGPYTYAWVVVRVRFSTTGNVGNGSIFRNCDRSRRSDYRSAVKVEAVVRASEVGIAPWTGLWQHEEAGAATRRSRPLPDIGPAWVNCRKAARNLAKKHLDQTSEELVVNVFSLAVIIFGAYLLMAVSAFLRNYPPALRKKLISRLDEYCAKDLLKQGWISASLDGRCQMQFIMDNFDRLPIEVRKLYRRLIWIRRVGW